MLKQLFRSGIKTILPNNLYLKYRYFRNKPRMEVLIKELNKLEISKAGVENDIPWITLSDETRLFGDKPGAEERSLYGEFKGRINPQITPEVFLVALDIITRYHFPHSLPGHTMPYPENIRKFFPYKYRETIVDLSISKERQQYLIDLFEPKAGETFVEVGA